MGTDRGGWYSWDRLDNFGRASARTIHPEWQDIAAGDHLAGTPVGSQWWEVAALDPERFLGHADPSVLQSSTPGRAAKRWRNPPAVSEGAVRDDRLTRRVT